MAPSLSSKSSYTPTIHFPQSSTPVLVYKSKDSAETEEIPLQSLIVSRCPSLFAEFRPPWWLFNGHLQTMYCVTGDFSKNNQVKYNRTYLRLLDGGTLGLDFTPLDDGEATEETPVIVVKHGLTGGSHESYVRAILAPACTSIKEGGLGYRAVVVNFRGCAGVPVTSPQLYSAGYTDDLRQALIYIRRRYPRAPLLGIGYSLGANVLTRYIAEEGENSRLAAGCALACPWNLVKNNAALNGSRVGRHVYSQGMGGNLLRLLQRHSDDLGKFSQHPIAPALVAGLGLKNPTMEDFDHAFTRIGGGSSPPFPFDSSDDYYAWASSHKVLPDIRVPFLAVNARDDPIVQEIPMNDGGNGWVTMAVTPKGGHLGWFEPTLPSGEVPRWITKPVLEWLKLVGEDLVHKGSKERELYEEDGFLIEVGRNNLGCKEIEGGGLVNGLAGAGAGGLLQGL